MARRHRYITAAALTLFLAAPILHAASTSIAVFTFDNLTGSQDHDWVGTGFAEALTDKLRNVDRLILRDRREIADIARVSQIDQKKIDTKNAAEIAKLMGCDYLVFGAVQAAGAVDKPTAPLRATARIVETRTGRISKAIQLDGTMGKLFDLQSRLALDFTALLNVEVSVVAKNAIEQHGTDSLLAYKLYCEGLKLLDEQKYAEAIAKFKEACKRHPGILYAEAHHAMGTAYLRSGRKKEMLREFKGDVEKLSPLWFDLGVAYERAGKLDKAAEAFETFIKYTDRRFSPWQYGGARGSNLPRETDAADGLVLSEPDGYFHCLDNESGRLRWKKKFTPPARPVTLWEKSAYFGTAAGEIVCVNVLTGAIRWQTGLGAAITAPVQVVPKGGQAIVAAASGEVLTLDAKTGVIQWKKQLAHAITSIDGMGGVLYLGDSRGGVYAVDAGKGDIAWTRVAPAAIKGASVLGDKLYVSTTDGRLSAFRLKDGVELWSYTKGKPDSRAVPAQNGCILMLKEGAIALVTEDGKELWRHHPERTPRHLACAGNRVVYAADDNALVILDRQEGKVQERRSVDAAVAEMGFVGPMLLVHTADDAVHAFGFGTQTDDPDDREGYLRLAQVFEHMGKVDAAIDTYRLILGSVDTHCIQAMYALVRIYKKQGKNDLARAMEQRARRMSANK